jgi:hypothetical protein
MPLDSDHPHNGQVVVKSPQRSEHVDRLQPSPIREDSSRQDHSISQYWNGATGVGNHEVDVRVAIERTAEQEVEYRARGIDRELQHGTGSSQRDGFPASW